MQIRFITALAVLFAFTLPAFACEGTDCVLASRGDVNVYPIDLEASLGDLPPEVRAGVLLKPDRIDRLMDNVLTTRQLAEMAKAQGYDKDPIVQRQMLLAAEGALAEHARKDEMKRRSGDADFEAYAREQYAVRRNEFRVPPTTEVLHILIGTANLCQADALAQAQAVLAKANAGVSFEELVQQYSDDESKIHNGGKVEVTADASMDPAFKEAALALTTPGQIAGPVRSRYGYHLIKFVEKRAEVVPTFDQIKDSLMQNVRGNYEQRIKDTMNSDLRSTEPRINQEAMASFRARFHQD